MLNTRLKPAAILTAALAGLLFGAPLTRANSIEVTGVTTTLTNGVWDYAYSMTLSAGNAISATNPNGSSLFIFYDVNGLTGAQASFAAGTTAVADWTPVIENTSGVWANNLSSLIAQGGTAVENDLPDVPNVRFQYVGSPLEAGTTSSALGTANIYSTQAPGLYGQFAARWVGNSDNTQINSQSVLLPAGGAGASAVPLPSAIWMGGSMMAGLAVFARARRRATNAA